MPSGPTAESAHTSAKRWQAALNGSAPHLVHGSARSGAVLVHFARGGCQREGKRAEDWESSKTSCSSTFVHRFSLELLQLLQHQKPSGTANPLTLHGAPHALCCARCARSASKGAAGALALHGFDGKLKRRTVRRISGKCKRPGGALCNPVSSANKGPACQPLPALPMLL